MRIHQHRTGPRPRPTRVPRGLCAAFGIDAAAHSRPFQESEP
jgi:hypothetical protein